MIKTEQIIKVLTLLKNSSVLFAISNSSTLEYFDIVFLQITSYIGIGFEYFVTAVHVCVNICALLEQILETFCQYPNMTLKKGHNRYECEYQHHVQLNTFKTSN